MGETLHTFFIQIILKHIANIHLVVIQLWRNILSHNNSEGYTNGIEMCALYTYTHINLDTTVAVAIDTF